MQPGLVAQFADGSTSDAASIAGAVPLPNVGGSVVRIYRLPAADDPTRPEVRAGSPVYREGDSPAGRLMALPGGVLVKFRPEWSRDQIDRWLAEHRLSVRAEQVAGSTWYSVKSPSGAASLELANALFETGDVLAAVPNWWKQVEPR